MLTENCTGQLVRDVFFFKTPCRGLCGATDLSAIEDASVDFAFASNLFEHLTQGQLAVALEQLRHKLKQSGTLNMAERLHTPSRRLHVIPVFHAPMAMTHASVR